MLKHLMKLSLYTCLLLFPISNRASETIPSMYYIKIGPTLPPGHNSHVLSTFGLGARFKYGYCGLDLSTTLSSNIIANYAVFKGMFLLYPQPSQVNGIYFGIGPGIGYHLGKASHSYAMITAEGVLGYECRRSANFKTFIQLEFSQPTFCIGTYKKNQRAGMGLIGGVGF
jgi:hypothetical protein